jgi:hypothetical protein
MQDSAPGKEYLPSSQGTTVLFIDWVGQKYPGLHSPVHAAVAAPPLLKLPAGHGAVQLAVARPGVNPYRPAAHAVHEPAPARLYVPALHTVAVALLLPAAHAYPAVHTPLQLALVEPVVNPYRPEGHARHFSGPKPPFVEYFPAGQISTSQTKRRFADAESSFTVAALASTLFSSPPELLVQQGSLRNR